MLLLARMFALAVHLGVSKIKQDQHHASLVRIGNMLILAVLPLALLATKVILVNTNLAQRIAERVPQEHTVREVQWLLYACHATLDQPTNRLV